MSVERDPTDRDERDFETWLRNQVEAEPYFFQKLRLRSDLATPGWSDPRIEKLPYYGLPDDLTGKRVLDIGCAEGFFSFEAERRGAEEIVAIDSFPDSVRRFNIVRAAYGSRATAYLSNVYDLSPKTFGTFDVVLFYGVLYHLRHPLLALERILEVCTGTMRLQTACSYVDGMEDVALSRFYPRGKKSGPDPDGNALFDPTIFWMPNRECVRALVDSVGFVEIETLCERDDVSIVLRADSPLQAKGEAPDQMKAPWS